MKNVAIRSARVAVLFGRQAEADGMTIDEIADDALTIALCGRNARRALERQRSVQPYIDRADAIADRYAARLVPLLDLNGCVFALRFRTGLYSSGRRDLFYLS